MLLQNERLIGGKVLEDLVFYEIHGPEAESYLFNQTTNILPSKIGFGEPNVFVTNKGAFICAFYLYKKSEQTFWAIVSKKDKDRFLERLELFHISEEFETNEFFENYSILVGEQALDNEYDKEIPYWFYGYRAKIVFEKSNLEEVNGDALKLFHGFHEKINRKLFTETRYIDFCYDKNKGCFPGQETVAKIVNNRGAALFPCLLKGKNLKSDNLEKGEYIDSWEDYHLVLLPRENRINHSSMKLGDSISREVLTFPVLEETPKEWAEALSDMAYEKFHEGNNEEAKKLLHYALNTKDDYADAYEMLGVIYGREDNYQVAIELMKKLSEIDSSSIMAHTNLSLYYMKVGEIEKAEDEKSKAMLKEFEKVGQTADAEEVAKKQKEEWSRKESMYKQVLEIDPDDFIAIFGLGELAFIQENFEMAKSYLSKAIDQNKKHSQSYLLLGKSLVSMNKNDEAKLIFEKGIKIAASQGDMMPANEMQSLLNNL